MFYLFYIHFDLITDYELPWALGDYVLVNYAGTPYPGVVTQIHGTETEVDCMIRSGQFWKWPVGKKEKDLIWYRRQDIIKKISEPVPVSHRGQMKFSDL